MMNLLVGILGSNYERYEEQSQALFVRERARIITLQSVRPYPWVHRVWRRMQDGDLYFVTKEAPETEEERSTRKAMQILILQPLKKQIKSLEAKVDQNQLTQAQLRKQNESLESKVMELDAKLSAFDASLVQILRAVERDERA